MDGNEVLAGRLRIDAPLGWMCPGCGRIYSPQYSECAWCAPQAAERLEQLRETPESAEAAFRADRAADVSNLLCREIRSAFWSVGARAWIGDVLVHLGLAAGRREARRLIAQGAVFFGDMRVTDEETMIEIARKQRFRVGRHKVVDLIAGDVECPSA